MQNGRRVLWWLAATVSIIVGLLLVWHRDHNGWFLVILGTVYLGGLTVAARGPAASNPRLARWEFVGITLLLLVLAVIVGAVLRR